MAVTSIYLAGKIGKNDWRTSFGHGVSFDNEDPGGPWPVLPGAVFGMDYVGPYFIGDDHGCAHGPGNHGYAAGETFSGHLTNVGCVTMVERNRVASLCANAIKRANIFFAWFDDLTAYGTLVEIGYAAGLPKRPKIIIAVAQSLIGQGDDDLWFALETADRVIYAASPIKALGEVAEQYVPPRLDSPIEQAFWAAWNEVRPPTLTSLQTQYEVLGGRYRLDFALPSLRVGIELDGYEYHSSRDAFTKDRQRHREIEAAGWRIIRFSGSEVKSNPKRCVAEAASWVGTLIQREVGSAQPVKTYKIEDLGIEDPRETGMERHSDLSELRAEQKWLASRKQPNGDDAR